MSIQFDRVKAGLRYIVVHHTASMAPLLKAWNPFNYEFPEYDFGIDHDGSFHVGRPLTYSGAHCENQKLSPDYPPFWMNKHAIGFVLAGSFDKKKVEEKQVNEAAYNLKRIAAKYKIPLDREHIIPHFQVDWTYCPGRDTIEKIWKKIEK